MELKTQTRNLEFNTTKGIIPPQTRISFLKEKVENFNLWIIFIPEAKPPGKTRILPPAQFIPEVFVLIPWKKEIGMGGIGLKKKIWEK